MTKTWLITGASSGLGRLMTERLLARGDRVVATVRHEDSLTDLQKKHGDRLVVPALDLTDTAGIRAVLASAFRQLGRIDVLVSNAGYGLFGAAEEVTDAQIDHQIATNLIGSIQFIRAAIPHLRQQGGGRIVQVSSEGGQIAYPAFSLYHATKWGIEGFIESAAQEVAPFGIDSVIAAMISVAGGARPALRLALGTTAYDSISPSLAKGLAAIEAQRNVAFSADRNSD